MSDVKVVCCAEVASPAWRWVEASLADPGVRFEFARCVPRNALERSRYFSLARLRGSLEAVRLARRTGAHALVTHGATLAAWCALFARLHGLRIPILAHSFNFTTLPSRVKRSVFAFALSRVDRFVVYSTVERELYAKSFSLPVERFDVVLWGVQPPEVEAPDVPIEKGDYVCALGGNARDYSTLIEAAHRLPDVRFVLVVRPESLTGLDVPLNVKVYTNLPFGQTMNALLHSRFMVLPLVNSEVPCGHVTLVAAMHLGKAFVITDSAGVRDYVRREDNALTMAAGSVDSLTAAIERLRNDPALCVRLGENGRRFASRECTEERIAEHFRAWIHARLRGRDSIPGTGAPS